MGISYEVISWDDRGWAPQYGTIPSSVTVTEAARHAGPADTVVAVENGSMRHLTPTEESEFQSALGHDPSRGVPVRVPQPELSYEELKRAWQNICDRMTPAEQTRP